MKTFLVFLAAALLAGCSSRMTVPVAAVPVPVPVAAPASPDWRARVTEAKALADPTQKSEAMLTLVREALSPHDVRLSGDGHPDQVHLDDNRPAPIVNFDPGLNQKTSAQSRSGTPTRSLQNNFGYYFSVRGAGYVVLGPAALDPRSPVLTRLAAEHELFHASNHVGDPRTNSDRELETWSEMFVRFFRNVHQFRQQWRPMLNYYDEAGAGEQKLAIERLASYHRNAAGSEVRAAFEEWLARRKADTPSSKLVNDLEKAIAGTPAGS